MISICTVLSALATAAVATGFNECNFSEPTGGRQCFGAAGQLFLFHLPNTDNKKMTLTKDDKYLILKVKNQTVTLNENYTESQNEAEFFASGTLILGNAMKKHSGKYVLEIFESNGNFLKRVNVQLEIQEPVSEPAVSQMCVSPEQMKVRCSSKGDGVELSLKLAGQLLLPTGDQSPSPGNWTTDTPSVAESPAKQDESSVSEITISLHGQLTGSLKCTVTNKVSRHEAVIHLTSCKDSLSSPLVVTVPVIVGVVTLLVLLALCVGRKTLQNKQRPTTVTGGDFEDEVVYTEVRVTKKQNPKKPQNQVSSQ